MATVTLVLRGPVGTQRIRDPGHRPVDGRGHERRQELVFETVLSLPDLGPYFKQFPVDLEKVGLLEAESIDVHAHVSVPLSF